MKFVVGFIICIALSFPVLAQNAPRIKAPNQDQLFVETSRPAHGEVPFPENAAFVTINTKIFDEVTAGLRNLDRIEDFPMPDGSKANLVVEQFDVLTKSSKILAGTASGDVAVEAPKHILLHGFIEGEEGSHLYFAVFREHCIGYIQQPEADRILFSPAFEMVEGMAMPHVIYYQYDVDPKFRTGTWHCATEELPANQEAMKQVAAQIRSSKNAQIEQANVRLIGIGVECDNDFYKDFGSDFATAQKYAIAVLGAMSDIYARDANCAVKASSLRIWQTEDPYTGTTTGDLLSQFQSGTDIGGAASLLFSGIDALGGGLAVLGGICNGSAYAVCGMNNNYAYPTDKYIWDTDVTSHEFGHNVGSVHTHNCSWAPPIDSCVASEGGCYSTPKPRKGTIMSYCHQTSFGTDLKIHSRVGTFMKQRFQEGGCTDNVNVPVAKATGDKMICKQASTPLSGTVSGGTPPYEVLWFNAAGTPLYIGLDTMTLLNVNASPNRTTSYVFRVTDANNVRAYDTVVVAIDTVTVEAGPNTITICGVDSLAVSPISFSGRGKVTFEWRENASDKLIATGQNVKLPAMDTMTYKVIATDSLGCTGQDLITINPIPKPSATITKKGGSGGFCQGVADTLDAGAGFTTYKWSTGSTSQRIVVTQSGTYSCIVTKGGAGCSDTAEIVITKKPAPEKPKITFENSVLKCPLVADYYRWYRSGNIAGPYARQANGDQQNFNPPNGSGYYFVVVGNSDSCETRSDTLFVTVNSVNDVPAVAMLRIYPNPAKQSVTIDAGEGHTVTNLYITDVTGKKLWSSQAMAGELLSIDIAKWSAGSYLLHYTADGRQYAAKFVKE